MRNWSLVLLCSINFTFSEAWAASNSKTITIYGFEQGLHLKYSKLSTTRYFLQAGAFSNRTNAIHYKELIAQRIKIPVRIIQSNDSSGHYRVILGPFSGELVVKVSKALLSKKPSFKLSPNRKTLSGNMLSSHIAKVIKSTAPLKQTPKRLTKIVKFAANKQGIPNSINDLRPKITDVAGSPAPINTETPLTHIQQLRKAGRVNDAINFALNQLKQHPEDIDIQVLLGLLLLQQKNYAQAEAQLRPVIQKQPTYIDARLGLIQIQLVEQKNQEALTLINDGLKISPNNSQLQTLKAIANKISSSSPKTPTAPANNNIIVTLQQLRNRGQFEAAKAKAIAYLTDNSNNIDVQLQLGLIYYDLKEFAQAEEKLQSVLVKVPTYMDARIGLIKVKIAEKKYQEAELLVKEGLKKSPNNQALLSSQALIQQAQASTSQKSVVQSNPLMEIQTLRQKGQLDAAKEKAIAYLKTNPKDVDVKIVLGSLYLQQKQKENAEIAFKAVLEQQPNYIDARLGLIKIKLSEKKYDEANTLVQQGLQLAPNNQQLKKEKMLIVAAQKELTSKQNAEAPTEILAKLKQLRSTRQDVVAKNKALHYLKHHPEDVDVMVVLGAIYFGENNFTEAENLFNYVLLKVPTYIDARIGLIKIKIAEQKFQAAENLINEGYKLNAYHSQLNAAKALLVKARTEVSRSQIATPKLEVSPLPLMRTLRSEGKLQLAIEKGLSYLQHHDDVDVRVLVGLIYFQMKNYHQAENHLLQALNKVPTYLDARVGLIKIKIMQHQYQPAMLLVKAGLIKNPGNNQLLIQKRNVLYLLSSKNKKPKILSPAERALAEARIALAQKNYSKAKRIFSLLLLENPNNVEARMGLADYHLALYSDLTALSLIQAGRKLNPGNPQLLFKEGEIQAVMRQYPIAAEYYKEAMRLPGQQETAKKHLAEINSITPNYTYGVNEIGVASDNAYVPDLRSIWNYSTGFYKRDTEMGPFVARLNYASRLAHGAPQYQLEFSPRYNRNIYFNLWAAYSDQPILFPKYIVNGEGFFNIPNFVEVSAGAKYSNIGPTFFTTYTGSINYYPENFWLSFRPYFFAPKDHSKNSILYTGVIRRYFNTTDHFLSLGLGSGHSPDLSDLLTVNFIVIRNNYVNLSYEFPIFNHHYIIDLGVGYQRWQYPSNLIRNLYNGSVGIKYRF